MSDHKDDLLPGDREILLPLIAEIRDDYLPRLAGAIEAEHILRVFRLAPPDAADRLAWAFEPGRDDDRSKLDAIDRVGGSLPLAEHYIRRFTGRANQTGHRLWPYVGWAREVDDLAEGLSYAFAAARIVLDRALDRLGELDCEQTLGAGKEFAPHEAMVIDMVREARMTNPRRPGYRKIAAHVTSETGVPVSEDNARQIWHRYLNHPRGET
jgi:hypothetical protein